MSSCINEGFSLEKSSLQTPIIQNHRINICFSSTLPPWSNTSACHFPAVLSQTRNSKQGEKLTLDLCSLSRHVFKCISAVPRHHGSWKTPSLVKIPQMPTWNNERWPSPSALFNKQSTLLNSSEPRPARWKSSWCSQERLCLQLQLLEALTRAWALTLVPFVLRSVCGSVQHSLQTTGWSDEKLVNGHHI